MLWASTIDTWSCGCVIAELILGTAPFQGESVPQVLSSQVALCGPMPWHMINSSPELSAMYFTAQHQVYEVDPIGMPLGVYLLSAAPNASLNTLLQNAMDAREEQAMGESILDLVLRCLTLDPLERIGAQETIQHAGMLAVAWADVHDDSAAVMNLILSNTALEGYM